MEACRLAIRGLRKAFATPVLRGVDIAIVAGEVHAIVGENGAGKSTLVNILAGLLAADEGECLLDGERYEPAKPRDAFAAGVSFAAQELALVDTLSVAENIGLRKLPRRMAAIDRQALDRLARDALAFVDAGDVDPRASVAGLSLADRQRVELARAMAADCRLLVLDEPTAALTAQQALSVHCRMAKLAARGVSVIYISHRLKDVLDVADTVTVLRDGKVVSSRPAGDTSGSRMLAEMTGRTITGNWPTGRNSSRGHVLLEARALTTEALTHPIDLKCHSGEIVGIAGLAGAGKSELLRALFGHDRRTGGELVRHLDDGQKVIPDASEAVRAGTGFVAEDRQSMGLFPHLSVLANIMVPGATSVRGALRATRTEREIDGIRGLIERLDIRCAGPRQRITELSGGNQQKTLIARWLRLGVDVLLLDEPTRGVDVATKHAICNLLCELRGQGKAVVIASSETEELMAVCDRIVVLSNGRPATKLTSENWSEEAILAAAFSGFERRDDIADPGIRR